ncbi:Protein MAIN-LIKE 1 [Glycine max]|nr:Protein MAIN-LIKE 1 [Glycine max]
MIRCHGSYVRLSWLRDVYQMKIDACHWIVAVRAYLLHLLGCTLFANKSVTYVHVVFLDALRDLTQSGTYACVLLHLCIFAEDYDEGRPRACRWTSGKALPVSTYRRHLDRLTPDVVCWIPYDVHQQPVAAMTPNEANVVVHHLRHVVDGYVAIADKLERLLNLRILTEGTKAYTIAEECLSIARSYISQPTIGHKSRRRRRTYDH